ncbi:hypothetical protein Hypma_006572 [Hypsizygus marmoreus]|uniref:N-acetyltransferase domain-containing protein n=1 Tax=Hypsizygus marmoreus TaxID=39966 RepID=A0A369K2R3_HYPMA|nr:hypothetical protein Hypma_006572 [Hypsizygus marmoreus]
MAAPPLTSLPSPEHYKHPDVNFNIPLPLTFETRRVRLTPFIPTIHGEAFYSGFQADPDFARYFPMSFPTYATFLDFFETYIRSDPASVLFTIIDKTKTNGDENNNLKDCVAGIIGLLHSSPLNRSLEIGPVIVLPPFQRTFVSSNAIGLLLKYVLNVPSEGGLGFRRVVWTANPDNMASVKAAERMGFKQEGVMRWTWCLPPDKAGKKAGNERGDACGRDSILLSLCWDDWENGGKEQVDKLIERV